VSLAFTHTLKKRLTAKYLTAERAHLVFRAPAVRRGGIANKLSQPSMCAPPSNIMSKQWPAPNRAGSIPG